MIDKTPKVEDLGYNLVLENCHYMKGLTPLWLNKRLPYCTDCPEVYDLEKRFLDDFSYGIKDTFVFDDIEFDSDESISAYAERYGGYGTGLNGGGARCLMVNGFHIKGSGKNILAGAEQDVWHSYGGLNLVDAVYEAIFSEILNKLSPIGSVNVLGIIYTGKRSALNYEHGRTHGALLIREAFSRPAHYFPISNFKYGKNSTKSDSNRVTLAIKDTMQRMGGVKCFSQYLAWTSARVANQLSFSLIARLCHGSLASTNISMDGRWADLTNTSFLPSGKNYGGLLPFFNERYFFFDLMDEWSYNIAKHLRITFNGAPIANNYRKTFDYFLSHHISYFLGLPYPEKNPSHENLKELIVAILTKNIDALHSWPHKNEADDSAVLFLSSLTLSSENKIFVDACRYSACSKINHSVIDELNELFRACYKRYEPKMSFFSFFVKSKLTALKRCFYISAFYKQSLEGEIRRIVDQHETPGDVSIFIEESLRYLDWISSGDTDSIVDIYRSNDVNIHYDCLMEKYIVYDIEYRSFSCLRDAIVAMEDIKISSMDNYYHKHMTKNINLLCIAMD